MLLPFSGCRGPSIGSSAVTPIIVVDATLPSWSSLVAILLYIFASLRLLTNGLLCRYHQLSLLRRAPDSTPSPHILGGRIWSVVFAFVERQIRHRHLTFWVGGSGSRLRLSLSLHRLDLTYLSIPVGFIVSKSRHSCVKSRRIIFVQELHASTTSSSSDFGFIFFFSVILFKLNAIAYALSLSGGVKSSNVIVI